jgi:hypothetical protein
MRLYEWRGGGGDHGDGSAWRAGRPGREDRGGARLDAGVDQILDLVDVRLGGLVEGYRVAVRHLFFFRFPGKCRNEICFESRSEERERERERERSDKIKKKKRNVFFLFFLFWSGVGFLLVR